MSNGRHSSTSPEPVSVIDSQKKAVITEMKETTSSTITTSKKDPRSVDQSKWEYQGRTSKKIEYN